MVQKRIEDAYVHRALVGEAATVKRAFRKVAKQAVDSGTWAAVVKSEDLLPATQLQRPRSINLSSSSGRSPFGTLFHGFPVIEELHLAGLEWSSKQESDRKSKCVHRLYELTTEGCRSFWFVLGVLSNNQPSTLPGQQFVSDVGTRLAFDILGQVLPWFDVLEALSDGLVDRISGGWQDWGVTIPRLCYRAGLGERAQALFSLSLPELKLEVESLLQGGHAVT